MVKSYFNTGQLHREGPWQDNIFSYRSPCVAYEFRG